MLDFILVFIFPFSYSFSRDGENLELLSFGDRSSKACRTVAFSKDGTSKFNHIAVALSPNGAARHNFVIGMHKLLGRIAQYVFDHLNAEIIMNNLEVF